MIIVKIVIDAGLDSFWS